MSKPSSHPTFSKGDKVRLIFTDEIGIVLQILDRETVLLDVAGTDIPAFVEHLELLPPPMPVNKNTDSNSSTSIRPNTGAGANKKNPPVVFGKQGGPLKPDQIVEKIKAMGLDHIPPDDLPDKGLQLIMQPFLRPDGIIDYFLLHFINNSGKPVEMDYQMFLDTQDGCVFELQKLLGGREKIILNSLQYDDLNENPEMLFYLKIHCDDDNYEREFEKSIRPKPRLLRNEPLFLDDIQGRGYVQEICRHLPQKKPVIAPPSLKKEELHPVLEKIKHFEAEELRKNPDREPAKVTINAKQRVVDLHIEQLLPVHKHLKNGEILHIQITHFDKQIQEAIQKREPNLIVIHGNGKGKLRQEIFNLLREYPQVCNFDNSYDHRFGFGATLIELSY